ncbi:MAG: hypothetical protein ABIR96_10060 [Bdellovibrionota bacterium]
MKLRILFFLILLQLGRAKTLEENLTTILSAERGSVAFCKPSLVDELQIIGTPRQLSPQEAQQLGALFGAEETYFERQADGALVGRHSFCMVHWDFKILLTTKEGSHVTAIRLCSGCHQLAVWLDGQAVDFPDVRSPAMSALITRFDAWFPGWKKKTERNRLDWHNERKRSSRLKTKTPNQALQRNAGTVPFADEALPPRG